MMVGQVFKYDPKTILDAIFFIDRFCRQVIILPSCKICTDINSILIKNTIILIHTVAFIICNRHQ